MRRSHHRRRRFVMDSDGSTADEDDNEGDDDDEDDASSTAVAQQRLRMKCLSCKDNYGDRDARTCRECYVEAGETEEELKLEIEELKSKFNFLRLLCAALNSVTRANTSCFSDVVLVACGSPDSPDMACNSPSIPAHRAVLPIAGFQSNAGDGDGGEPERDDQDERCVIRCPMSICELPLHRRSLPR